MGHRIEPGTEAAVLRELISEARRAAAELRAAIKEAKELAPDLVGKFEQIHADEVAQLSNFFTEEANRHAAGLNADIDRARKMILEEIMAGEVIFDRHTYTVSIKWPAVRFADNQPLPYPNQAPKETSK